MQRAQAEASVTQPVYVDHFATTPLDPRVFEAMVPFYNADFGNPSSDGHIFGQRARQAVEGARDTVRQAVGGSPDSGVIFTGGATESNNLAIRGTADFEGDRRKHFVVSSVEHKSVLEPMRWLANNGRTVSVVPVDANGIVDLQTLERTITPETALVSVMAVNNETGAVQPIREIGAIAKERGVRFHCDATQGAGKVPLNMVEFGIDYLSLSAHKIYGPKGIGALCTAVAPKATELYPLTLGGGQEHGLRSGTLNVPGIVALAKALEIMLSEVAEEALRIRQLRDKLKEGILANVRGVSLNGDSNLTIPGALNLSIDGVRSTALLARFQEIAISGAAACGGQSAKSHVLSAMGLDRHRIQSALRFCVGRFNTPEDIDAVVERVTKEVGWIRAQPTFGMSHSV